MTKQKRRIQLSDHFTYKKILRFTLPPIAMMVFTSIYGVVDGLFVSNFVGKSAFAAVNFMMPFLMMMSVFGFMFGAGGSALVAKTMGEGDRERANRLFTMFVVASIIFGAVISVVAIIFLRPIASLMGAEGEMLDLAVKYGRIILIANVFFMLQVEFHTYCVTAEKPKMGLYVTLLAGITNMAFDALLMGVCHMGVEGAALATALSQVVGGGVPLIYFACKNSSLLRLVKFRFDGRAFLKACTNGSSELMTNVSMSLVNMLYNVQLMKYVGENGVAAYGVLMYVNFIFVSMFIGYTIGISPIVGFHYGAANHEELKSMLKKSLILIAMASALMLGISQALASPLSKIFVGYDKELCALTTRAFRIYTFSFLLCGFNVFGSAFFTALNNGLISAIISFLRTLVFQILAVMLLPLLMDVDGIWLSIVVAEVLSVIVSAAFLFGKRKKYHYL